MGVTAHSAFRVGLDGTVRARANTPETDHIRRAEVVIFDEIFSLNVDVFEAMAYAAHDAEAGILGTTINRPHWVRIEAEDTGRVRLFGNKTVVLGGHRAQVLPIVEWNCPHAQWAASVASTGWLRCVQRLTLRENKNTKLCTSNKTRTTTGACTFFLGTLGGCSFWPVILGGPFVAHLLADVHNLLALKNLRVLARAKKAGASPAEMAKLEKWCAELLDIGERCRDDGLVDLPEAVQDIRYLPTDPEETSGTRAEQLSDHAVKALAAEVFPSPKVAPGNLLQPSEAGWKFLDECARLAGANIYLTGTNKEADRMNYAAVAALCPREPLVCVTAIDSLDGAEDVYPIDADGLDGCHAGNLRGRLYLKRGCD